MGTQEGWERQSTCPKRQKKGQKHLQDFPCYRKTLLLLVQDDPGFHGGEENLNPKSQGSTSWHLAPLSCPPRVWASCRWTPRGCGPLGCVRNIWRLRPTGLGRERCPAPRGF